MSTLEADRDAPAVATWVTIASKNEKPLRETQTLRARWL